MAVLLLRYAFAIPDEDARFQTMAFQFIPQKIVEAVWHPTPFVWPLLLIAMLWPLAWLTRTGAVYRKREENALIAAGRLVALVTLMFGLVNELRVFLPASAIVLYANLRAVARGVT